MKKVIFSQQQQPESDFRDLVIQFLVKHGMSDDHARSNVNRRGSSNSLEFSFNCSNHRFTKAFSLLQLVFTQDDEGYFAYTDGKAMLVTSGGSYEHLKNHMDIEIID